MTHASRLGIFALVALACAFAGGCGGSSTFVRQSAGWKSIELRPGLSGDFEQSWQTAVDTIARNYDIEIMDKSSGYMRTGWKYGILGQATNVMAGRITVKFPSVTNPDRVDVKTDAQRFNQWTSTWEEGVDSRFERDVINELSGRLGRTAQ